MALDIDYTQTDLLARRDTLFLSTVADQSPEKSFAYRKAVTIDIPSLKLLTETTKKISPLKNIDDLLKTVSASITI